MEHKQQRTAFSVQEQGAAIQYRGSGIGHRVSGVYEKLRRTRPRSRRDLANYIKVFLGIDVPDTKLCDGHATPMDYLWYAYSSDDRGEKTEDRNRLNGDCIVWANRGGGKTELAAIATLLDCIFKPGCQIRILGGSGEQSGRMYEYLTSFVAKGFEAFLAGPVRKERCAFLNGSTVEVLTQSATSVRGTHVQKLRCDEVELFDEQVFSAAKFVTHSKDSIIASMETISTMHRPYGLMQRLITDADKNNTPVFKWCMWEVIEKCTERTCSQCPLWGDCGGRAKRAAGYLKIDDCITQMRRASRAGFESEMLCRRPLLENVVFAEFDPALHVEPVDYDRDLPLYRALDFGFVNPFVCLWLQVDSSGCVRVIDEYVRSRAAVNVHADEIKRRTPCSEERVAATFCDPAGAGRNDVTGTSSVKELRSMGIRTRYRRSNILAGIELIRRALRAGDGASRLVISPRCVRLIEALQCYHYPDTATSGPDAELPLKDGVYDHPIDALRYFFSGLATAKTTSRRY
ncbi:MAG TPA: hypothetical protein HPP87_01060 [Planctomycetes bacterium]|nr:hypothetical protein [Planctomycetota bacterium]HIJ69932.1 hypothetical protein [Planctomycetota bacterium]